MSVCFSFAINESAPLHSFVGQVSTTSDVDHRFIYEIKSGDETRHFAIGNDGRIITAAALDRERQSEYQLLVCYFNSLFFTDVTTNHVLEDRNMQIVLDYGIYKVQFYCQFDNIGHYPYTRR